MAKNVAEMSSGQSNRAVLLLPAPSLYFNSPSEIPHHLVQTILNHNVYHSDLKGISST
jgi:hypothetical protein